MNEQTESRSLLPCPFCSGERLFEGSVPNTGGNRRFIWCHTCCAHGPWSTPERKAREQWERRSLQSETERSPESYEGQIKAQHQVIAKLQAKAKRALREIAKMMDEAEAVLRSEVLAGNVVKESAARGELVGLRQARAVLTVPLNESHALRREPGKARTPQEVAEQWKDWIPYPDSSVAEWDRFTLASYIARSATASQDEKDAARYRWLREHPIGQLTSAEEKEWWPSVWMSKDASYPLQAGFLDDEVDAAMRRAERTIKLKNAP